jgi:hypothetical protein
MTLRLLHTFMVHFLLGTGPLLTRWIADARIIRIFIGKYVFYVGIIRGFIGKYRRPSTEAERSTYNFAVTDYPNFSRIIP